MTKLADIGEFGLIKRFSAQFENMVSDGITGIGDDCAVIPAKGNDDVWLVTTDMLIEDRHFIREKIAPYELGYKSLAVNLSDVAAMGGSAHSAYLSIGIPESIDVERLDEFFSGINDLCTATGTLFLGGDTTKSPEKLIINIVVLGRAHLSKVKYRKAAKPGDMVCVTDNLGDSGAGLKAILEKIELNEDVKFLIKKHHMPNPLLKEGLWLGDQPEINAMIDVSDGIESDIHRIMESSGTGAEINLDQIPISPQCKKIADLHGWNIVDMALTGGEDYCLMFTLPEYAFKQVKEDYQGHFHQPFYPIGQITENIGNLVFKYDDKPLDIKSHGFDHFRS